MNDRVLESGATVYSQHGQEAEFVARAVGEYIVRPIYEDEDGPRAGDVEAWREVFRTPPAPKLDEATAEAEARLSRVRAQVAELESTRNAFRREEEERKARVQRHEALAELDRYLAGEITHYVTFHQYDHTVAILPVTETIESHPSSYQFGMLTLYPCKNWQGLQWLLNYHPKHSSYSSDSRTERVMLCCGEDDAKEKARAYLQTRIADMLALEPAKRHYADALIKNCRQHGVEVPQELLDHVNATRVQGIRSQIEDHLKKVEALEKQLAA